MKATVVFLGLLVSCVYSVNFAQSSDQQQDEDVRGAFLTTRLKTADKSVKADAPAKTGRRRPKTQPVKPQPIKDVSTNKGVKSPDNGPTRPPAQRIGLGLTLFTRDSNGMAVRVDPSHEFHKGDRVRLLLESNTDGYLYILNTTDGGQPVLIYPDPALDQAGNFIQAHVPVELPSSVAVEERLRWLIFDEHAGAERLYFVFTPEPLPGIPIEDDLINHCREKISNCPLHPAPELWNQIQKQAQTPVKIAKTQAFGSAQTDGEHAATTRGIGLSQEDPEPSLIMLTASSNTGMLATTLDLIHK